MKTYIGMIFLVSILSSQVARAQISESVLNNDNLDFAQETVSKNLYNLTNKIDTYFGDQVPLHEKNGSNIKVEYLMGVKERSTPTTSPDLDINVRFRQLEKKLNFKFSSDKRDEDTTLQNQETAEDSSENNSIEESIYRASIGFFKEQEKYWNVSFYTGVKIESRLNPFAKAGARKSFYFGETELRLENSMLVEDIDGMFNDTDINVNRKLSQDFSFTYANKFVWEDKLNELITVHGPSIYQLIDDNQSISYNIRTRFFNRPKYAITGHEVFTSYRRNLYKQWIVLYLTPGISFLAQDDYEKTVFFTTKLQALFGDF